MLYDIFMFANEGHGYYNALPDGQNYPNAYIFCLQSV